MKSRYVAGAALIVTATLPVISTASVSADAKIGPGERRCFAVEGEPGDAAVVNLTPVQAEGAGNGKLISSDVSNPSESSNVNFQPGTADPNVAIAPIGADGEVCFVNSNHASVHLVADHLGTIAGDVYEPALPTGEPERWFDSRFPGEPPLFEPRDGGCFLDSRTEGAGIFNITPVNASANGHALLAKTEIDVELFASNVNFGPGSVDPNLGIVPFEKIDFGPDFPGGRFGSYVCLQNSEHAHVDFVLDHLGTVDEEVFTLANEYGYPVRRLDTRFSPTGKIQPNAGACFEVAGDPGDAAIVNITPILADGEGNGQLVSSDLNVAPLASNVNYNVGTTDPNVAIAPIGADGLVCYVNSEHTTVHVVADHLGTIDAEVFTSANADGSPERVVDTRT
ncbi:hypothetical protein [Ilumatobacter fluminis]|nr:hypothetical protein [Ilumatobacter fluminis]